VTEFSLYKVFFWHFGDISHPKNNCPWILGFFQNFHNKVTLCSRVFGDLEKEPT
jgi:hypothetical protein